MIVKLQSLGGVDTNIGPVSERGLRPLSPAGHPSLGTGLRRRGGVRGPAAVQCSTGPPLCRGARADKSKSVSSLLPPRQWVCPASPASLVPGEACSEQQIVTRIHSEYLQAESCDRAAVWAMCDTLW